MGCCQGNDKGSDYEDVSRAAWPEAKGLLRLPQLLGGDRLPRGEKDRHLPLPGLCRIKTRTKPATKAGVRNIFGKEMKVAAKPAKKVVKAFPVQALKKQI